MYSDKDKKYFAELYKLKKQNPEFLKIMAERARAQRQKNPEKYKAYIKEKNAKRRSANLEKERARSRDWFSKNPDKRAAYQQNRSAKIKSVTGKISPDIRTKLLLLQRGICICCKKKLVNGSIHLDHIMPLTKGGKHADENLQLLCQLCNNQKYNKDPIEFMQSRGFLL